MHALKAAAAADGDPLAAAVASHDASEVDPGALAALLADGAVIGVMRGHSEHGREPSETAAFCVTRRCRG